MIATKLSKDDALRAAVADLPKLPWLAGDFVEADCRIGDDHDGYPSVWIRLIATDEAAKRPGFLDGYYDTRMRIRDHLRDAGILGDRWAYFQLESVSERWETMGDDE